MSEIFERLLAKRGFSEGYLMPEYEKLADPFLLPDMKKALERIKRATKEGEKIIIYGDYDADGVTASTLLNEALNLAGARVVQIMLPDRFKDGYGLNKKVVQKAQETGAKLVITVDCGSANWEVVEELENAGVDVIITDHHECPEKLPEAVAVVNPKRRDVAQAVEGFEEHLDELMALRDLAGVGVAFMVARAMEQAAMIPTGQEKWMLDLVLIGTVCDSMRMSGENRTLCYYGMKVLEKTRRVGLKELMRTSRTGKLSSEAIGFQLGPRINAAGRMANAEVALGLMMAQKRTEAARLAGELETLNARRREQQLAAMNEFRTRGVPDDRVLVMTGDWHEGVLGIIAGRLVEEYKRPAFVLTRVKTGERELYKGSGRSFGEFNLAEALKAMTGEIVGGGGHAGAAGVKVLPEKLEEFKEKLNTYYDSLGLVNQERFFKREADVWTEGFKELNLELVEELRRLEPFGVGNEVPVFGLREAFVLDKKLMGAEGQHLGLLVRGGDGALLKLVAFSAPEAWRQIGQGERANILISLEENEWNGTKSAEGRIVDLRGC